MTYGLGDTLDVVTKNLAVTLSAALSETLHSAQSTRVSTPYSTNERDQQNKATYLSTFSASRHV